MQLCDLVCNVNSFFFYYYKYINKTAAHYVADLPRNNTCVAALNLGPITPHWSRATKFSLVAHVAIV